MEAIATMRSRPGAGVWMLTVTMILALFAGPAQVRAQDESDDQPAYVGVLGPIESLSDADITVLGVTFALTADTQAEWEGGSGTPQDLEVGTTVGVRGYVGADGVLYADEVDVPDTPVGIGVRGSVEAVDAETVTVLGVTFARTDSTVVGASADDVLLGWDDLAPELYVEVMGYDVAGAYYAARIDLSVCWDECEPAEDIEVAGSIEALGAETLTVEGHTFIVTEATEIHGPEGNMLPFEDLEEGLLVRVHGAYDTEDRLYAYAIAVKPDDHTPFDPEDFVGVLGSIEVVSADELNVLGVTFVLDEHTHVIVMEEGESEGADDSSMVTDSEDGSREDLAVGQHVAVMGRLDADGTLYAVEVVIEAGAERAVGVRGPVDAVDEGSVTVLGVTFARTDTTQVGMPEKHLTWDDIHVGDYVEVLGVEGVGRLLALFVGFDVCWECDGEEPHEITVDGRIEQLVGPSLTVDGHRFVVTAETEIRGPMGGRLGFGDLQEGLMVSVSGFEGEDGMLYASFIHVHPDDTMPPEMLAGVLGPIEAVDETGVTVLGVRFLFTDHTYVVDDSMPHDPTGVDPKAVLDDGERADLSDLREGMVVGVQGAFGPEGLLYAYGIHLNVEPERGADVAVHGTVDAVDERAITVLGVTFHRMDSTLVGNPARKLEWDDLAPGDHVGVVGLAGDDGTFYALFIGLEGCREECGPDDGHGSRVQAKGRVEAVTNETLTVDGATFVVVNETEVRGPDDDFTFADIQTGMVVWVIGYHTDDGTLQARFIEVGVPRDRAIQLTGAIQLLEDSSLTVRGVTFLIVPDTRIQDREEAPVAYADLVVGQLVKVEGAVGLDGALYAGHVWIGSEDDADDVDERAEKEVEVFGVVQAVTETSVTVRGHDFTLLPVTVIIELAAASHQPGALQPGQMATIHGRVGSDGVLYALRVLIRPVREEELRMKGNIDAVNAEQIVVAGVPFAIGPNTEVLDRWERAGTPADLKVGMTVEVQAAKHEDVWEAQSIRVHRWLNLEVDLAGFIDEVDAFGGRITVLGRVFHIHPQAVMLDYDRQPVTVADLAAGQLVNLHAVRLPNGTLVALRIKLFASDASGELVIGGGIQALYHDTLEVAGLPVVVDAGTEISDRTGNALTIDDLAEGQQVAAHVQAQPDGTYLALRIKRKEVVEVAGSVGDLTDGMLSVQGTTFLVDENTLFLDAMNNPIDPSVLEPGHIVEVFGEQPETEAPEGSHQGATTASVETTTATRVTVLDYESHAAPTDVDEEPSTVPAAFVLHQNYPNPFNPTTTIAFELANAQPTAVRLVVYNVLGQEVRRLVNGTLVSGQYEVVWDARDSAGAPVASGVYLYRLQAGNVVKTNTMVLMK